MLSAVIMLLNNRFDQKGGQPIQYSSYLFVFVLNAHNVKLVLIVTVARSICFPIFYLVISIETTYCY